MRVEDRCLPAAIPPALASAVRDDVWSALKEVTTVDGALIINDTKWLAIRQSGKATPVVMNSANFLSKTFQNCLHKTGRDWEIEKELLDQTIDAYKEFELSFEAFYLDDVGLRAVVEEFWNNKADFVELVRCNWPAINDPNLDEMVWWLARMYYHRRIHDLSVFPARLHKYFKSTGYRPHRIRVAMEFETGYTASAYRAFIKLNTLYAAGLIDFGVFVATDRATAFRIWPASTRNVNYDELANRNYRRNVLFPIWEVLFRPDGYSTTVGYLGSDLKLYQPTATNGRFTLRGSAKQVYLIGKRRIVQA